MTKPATKEFVSGFEKYTPRKATVNGVSGRLWVKRELIDGALVKVGQNFVCGEANEIEVTCKFSPF